MSDVMASTSNCRKCGKRLPREKVDLCEECEAQLLDEYITAFSIGLKRIRHSEKRSDTMTNVRICHKCGKVFDTYTPKIVLCRLPEGGPEVVDFCKECEVEVMKASGIYGQSTDGEDLLRHDDAPCTLAYYGPDPRNNSGVYSSDPKHWRLGIGITTDEDLHRVKSYGIAIRQRANSHDEYTYTILPKYIAYFDSSVAYDEDTMGEMRGLPFLKEAGFIADLEIRVVRYDSPKGTVKPIVSRMTVKKPIKKHL